MGHTHYANNTGRTAIVEAKVSRGKENIYFYVQTAADLVPSDDSGWMRLFIDIDRKHKTGWEGYKFVINRANPGKKALIERSKESGNREIIFNCIWIWDADLYPHLTGAILSDILLSPLSETL